MTRPQLLLRIVAPALMLVSAVLSAAAFGGTQAGATGATTSGRHPVVPVTPRHAFGRTGLQNSLNWAGYAVTGTPISVVSGSWVVPTTTCPKNANQLDSTWIGIDGFASSDPNVEQVGTDSDCAKTKRAHRGTPTYYAWYEMYPAGAVLLPQATYPVAPGEVISGSVTVSGPNNYTLVITNGIWRKTLPNLTSTGSPQNSSAEWITEAPTNCKASGSCTVVQLADFGLLSFTNSLANGQTISSPTFTSTRIDMSNKSGKKLRAKTSALGPAGTAFTVTWLHK
jgi:Peptidase A4 family